MDNEWCQHKLRQTVNGSIYAEYGTGSRTSKASSLLSFLAGLEKLILLPNSPCRNRTGGRVGGLSGEYFVYFNSTGLEINNKSW